MKNIKVIITLLVLVLLLTPTFASAQNGGINMGGNELEFDKTKYDAAINKAFLGNVMGYQVILIKNGKIVSEIAGGYARNAADGIRGFVEGTGNNFSQYRSRCGCEFRGF